MLDIKRIRTSPDEVKAALRRRGNKGYEEKVDKLISLDARRRELSYQIDNTKAEQNKASKEIPQIKKEGGDASALLARMKELAENSRVAEKTLQEVEQQLQELLYELPNMPHASTPDGELDTDNVEVRRFGEPTSFKFDPQPHWDIGARLGILDPETAAKVTGARFHVYRGPGARLERAITNFFLNTHTANGYTEILPPFIANRSSMIGTGQLPKFEEDMFHLEGTEYYLIPTAEVPVTNLHRQEILEKERLPIYYCAYTPCFRAEAGSAGRDTRGLIRQHQFNKVELVKFCEPAHSYEELEKLTADAERVLQLLGLPYRVVALCGGDLGFSSAKTYDIEVWMPSYGRYVEISSCSNFEDFQARRASITFRTPGEKPQMVHTLNGSGVAVGRTTAAILENYQNADGSVTVPEILRPLMGMDVIKPIR